MTANRPRPLPLVIGGGVCLAVLAVAYARVGCFLDDWLHLALARAMPHPFDPFFHDRMLGAFFRPLGVAWWWLWAHLGDPGTAVRHLLALALHTGGAAVLGLAVRAWRNDDRAGWFAGLLWLTSPLALACVGWLSCAYDLLAALFISLTLWRALLFVKNGRRGELPLIVAFTLAACWSKESAYVLPLLALPLLVTTQEADNKRTLSTAGALILAVAAAYLHRFAVLGEWLGGYREIAASKTTLGLMPFLAVLHEQAPGWPLRLALIMLLLLAMMFAVEKNRLPYAAGLAATAAALLPALLVLRTPSMLAVMPARYLFPAALAATFPLACLVEAWPQRRRFVTALLVVLIASGAVIGVLSANVGAKRAAGERAQIDIALDHARRDLAAGKAVVYETGRRVVGLDAAVKTIDPTLMGQITVVNCGFPTHIVVSAEDGERWRPYWSPRLPANPSRGFGLLWGEVVLSRTHCRLLQEVQP